MALTRRLTRLRDLNKMTATIRTMNREFGGPLGVAQQLRVCFDEAVACNDLTTKGMILIAIVRMIEQFEAADQEMLEEEKMIAHSLTKCSRSEPEVGDREALIASKFRAMIDVQKTAEGERTNVSPIADSQ